jgi:pimeloyl-ACP methyl ester carboxylesterase
MATFVLIHGAGDAGWYWHLTEAELHARGHHTIAPDLPCDNDTASLDDYADTVADAAAGRQDLVIVGQSYGAFTATLAANQLPARLLVLLAGNDPRPQREPGPVVGQHRLPAGRRTASQARRRQDRPRRPAHQFLQRHTALAGRGSSAKGRARGIHRRLEYALATRCVAGRAHQVHPLQRRPVLPPTFMRRVAQERLGTIPDEVPGCHCAALSHPRELTGLLVSYLD